MSPSAAVENVRVTGHAPLSLHHGYQTCYNVHMCVFIMCVMHACAGAKLPKRFFLSTTTMAALTNAWQRLPTIAKVAAAGAAAWGARELFDRVTEKSLKGEVVVITGAGSGIGRLLSLSFASEGARVACWDINADACEKVAAEIRALGGEARAYAGDVSDRDAVYVLAGTHAHVGSGGCVDVVACPFCAAAFARYPWWLLGAHNYTVRCKTWCAHALRFFFFVLVAAAVSSSQTR